MCVPLVTSGRSRSMGSSGRVCCASAGAATARSNARTASRQSFIRRYCSFDNSKIQGLSFFNLDEELRCGPGADRQRFKIRAAQTHGISHRVARLDFDSLSRLEVIALDESEERRILIGDARHLQQLP